MTKLEMIAVSILKPINPTVIIILGLYTVVWGLWIANPFWTVFTQAPLFDAMAALAPEVFWGLQAVVAGLFITYGALKPRYNNVTRGAFIAFFHWFVIGLLYFAGDWQNTGGITSMAFAAYALIVWVNIRINKEYYKALNK